MLRERVFPQSLSARVFWLIVGIILLVEMFGVMPELGLERQSWLRERVMQARLVAMAINDGAITANPQARDAMLRLSGSEAITLTGGSAMSLLPARLPSPSGADIDLDHESLLTSIWRADLAVLGSGGAYARLTAACPPPLQGSMAVIFSRQKMAHHLRLYVAQAAARAAVLALLTGSLVFFALDRQLVRPMRVMTASIAGFRRNPGHAGLGGLQWLSGRGDNEIAQAARELVAMQDELRGALWRNARLAALGTAVAKISHDLRNILTSALLMADRFRHHGDPVVKQAMNTLLPAIERAVELVTRTLDFAQDGPPAVIRSPVALRDLIAEAAATLHPTDARVAIENIVPESLVLPLDRNQIYRVLANLLRNAIEAGASRIALKLEDETAALRLVITDNGPGLPAKVLGNLFRPFSGYGRNGGSGLGLAIARDLMRAHGGDLQLRRTGPDGTEFVLELTGGLAEGFAGDFPRPPEAFSNGGAVG